MTERTYRKITDLKEKIEEAEYCRQFVREILKKSTVITEVSFTAHNMFGDYVSGENFRGHVRLTPYVSKALAKHTQEEIDEHIVVLRKKLHKLMKNENDEDGDIDA